MVLGGHGGQGLVVDLCPCLQDHARAQQLDLQVGLGCEGGRRVGVCNALPTRLLRLRLRAEDLEREAVTRKHLDVASAEGNDIFCPPAHDKMATTAVKHRRTVALGETKASCASCQEVGAGSATRFGRLPCVSSQELVKPAKDSATRSDAHGLGSPAARCHMRIGERWVRTLVGWTDPLNHWKAKLRPTVACEAGRPR